MMAARLLCAAATLALCVSRASAQSADPPPLDPNAPLDPLPGLEVDWPDMGAPDAPSADAPQSQPTAVTPATPTKSKKSTKSDEGETIRYSVEVEGIAGVDGADAIKTAFRKSSALEQNRKRNANAAQIDRRSRDDSQLLAELLRSRGYYDALVTPRIDGQGDDLKVVLEADPGVQYHFSSVALPGLTAAGEDAESLRKAFAVQDGDPVIAEDVITAGAALKIALGQDGFALAEIGDQDIVVDHSTHLATLTLPVTPGPVAEFGAIMVSGKPPFDAHHVGVMARFRKGDRFRQSRIDDLRRALIATTLVADAKISLVPRDGGRVVDVDIKLEPAPSHTIAGEVGYGTGQGFRAEASWTDRNFFNPEGALTVRAVAGTKEQLLGFQLRRSNFRMRDQVLNLVASASHQKYDAYEAKTALLAGNIERQSNFIWHKKWTWVAGAELLATDERGVFSNAGLKDTRTFLIAAAPLSLGYDGSDSLLDPTRGFRLLGRASPEISAHGGQFTYGRIQLDASAYHPVSDTVVLAGRMRLGTILGAGVFDIAPSRRFYAGGGGSVRGYGYQQLGPKDMDGDPIGGRGLAEFGLEARIRLKSFGGNFGVVPFFDGGSLTEKALPDLKSWRFAAGVGARYYSSFGPIRIDVGVPLNRQKGDSILAVTVSLGQAF